MVVVVIDVVVMLMMDRWMDDTRMRFTEKSTRDENNERCFCFWFILVFAFRFQVLYFIDVILIKCVCIRMYWFCC